MRKRGQTLHGQTRELIIKLQDYFENERENGRPLLPVGKVQERVSQALGVSKRTIVKINKEKFGASGREENVLRTPNKRRRSKPVTDINNFDVDAIRSHVFGYYLRNEYPSRDKLLASLRAVGLYHGGKTALTEVLKNVGFQYKQTNKGKILLERPNVILKRLSFLRAAQKITNWDNVVFIDETSLDANYMLACSWPEDTQTSTSNVPIGREPQYIVCHAGSAKHGFVENGLLAFESKTTIDAAKYKEWFKNVLLPGLPESSLIFMHSTSYNTMQRLKAPTETNKKEELVAWLQKNSIDASMDMLKPELMKLVKDNKSSNVGYDIDVLALEHGHRVLRIPSRCSQYNAMGLIWPQIKGYVALHNTSAPFNTENIVALFKQACEKVTKDDWVQVVEKTKNVILEHLDRDITIDDIIDSNFIIYAGEDDHEDGKSSSESESD